MPRKMLWLPCAAALLVGGLREGRRTPMAGETMKPTSQFVFKTVGERKLVADVSYPEG